MTKREQLIKALAQHRANVLTMEDILDNAEVAFRICCHVAVTGATPEDDWTLDHIVVSPELREKCAGAATLVTTYTAIKVRKYDPAETPLRLSERFLENFVHMADMYTPFVDDCPASEEDLAIWGSLLASCYMVRRMRFNVITDSKGNDLNTEDAVHTMAHACAQLLGKLHYCLHKAYSHRTKAHREATLAAIKACSYKLGENLGH